MIKARAFCFGFFAVSDNMSKITFTVEEDWTGTRIDKYLSEVTEDLSRSYIQKIIDSGKVFLNGRPAKASAKVKENDSVLIDIPENIVPQILPEDIPLDIVYEDGDVIVVNKPKGMVVHPAPGHYSGTLVNALMYHCSDLSGINGVLRPGIVHRIDKDTSGLLVCAKNNSAHNCLAAQFKEHSIGRSYRAIVIGSFKDPEGTVSEKIGRRRNNRKLMGVDGINAKEAVTHYMVLESLEKYSYIECRLETGRTHQIRVHMAYIHHPVLGDTVYGGKLSEYQLDGIPLEGQTLHAKTLGFIHPSTGEYMEFDSELPEYFNRLLEKLR